MAWIRTFGRCPYNRQNSSRSAIRTQDRWRILSGGIIRVHPLKFHFAGILRRGPVLPRAAQRLRKAEAETEDSIPPFPWKQLTNRGLQPIAGLSRLRAPRHRIQGRRQHGRNPEWRLVISAAFQPEQRSEKEKCSAGFKLQPFARNFMDPVEISFGRFG